MAKATQPAFFLDESSEHAQKLQAKLTSGLFRCNLMMVQDAEHAAAMLRHECEQAVPDLLLVYGGLHDGRAAALVRKIKEDERLSRIRLQVVVDSAGALAEFGRQPAARSVQIKPLTSQSLEDTLAAFAGERFWWVMARFS